MKNPSFATPFNDAAWPAVIGHYQGALRDWRGTWLEGHDTHMRRLLTRVHSRTLTADQAGLVREAEAYYAAKRTALA